MSPLRNVGGVPQPAQGTGISASVGRLGPHSVQIGTNPPVRLDQIRGNDVPFAGFRTATRVASAKTGARQNAASALRALGTTGGAFDVAGILGSCKALQTHLDRLQRHGEIHGNMDDAAMAAFAPEVESLSNTELANVYQRLLSPETALLRRALQTEIRQNPHNADALSASASLYTLEALVLNEITNRVVVAQGLAPADAVPALSARYGAAIDGMGQVQRHAVQGDMTAVSLHVLANVASDSAARREKVDDVAQDIVQRRALDPIDARQFGDVLRSADLTINVDLGFLFGMSGPKPLLKAGGPWEHLFHSIEGAPDEAARQAAIAVKGEGYILKRDNVERGLFPELSEDRPAVASDRPTYAALNLLRFDTGQAASYGTVALHLKPEVARRATYTVDDTFFALRLRHTEAGREAVAALLPGWPGITPEHKAEMMRPGSDLRRQLEDVMDAMARKGTFRGDLFKNELRLPGLEDDENSALAGLFTRAFKDTDATRKAMVTYDNLEALLPELGEVDAVRLARAAVDREAGGPGRVATQCNYIEAQLHGPLVLARDVQEIVIVREFGADTITDPVQQAWMRAVIAVLGGKTPETADMDMFTPAQRADLGTIREQLGGATIPVRIEEQIPELGLKQEIQAEDRVFYAAHLDQPGIDARVRAMDDDATFRGFMTSALTTATGGSSIVQVMGDVPLIPDADLAAVRTAFSATVERFRHAPERGQYDENALLNDCMNRVLREHVGADRMDCLAAVADLTPDPALRGRLRDMVMAQAVPMTGAAFRAVAATALEGAALLRDVTRQAPEGEMTHEAMAARLGTVAGAFSQRLAALPAHRALGAPGEAGEAGAAPTVAEARGRLLQQCGGMAFALAGLDGDATARAALAARLDAPDMRSLSAVTQRLGDPARGFAADAAFGQVQAFNALLSGMRTALGEQAMASPAPFGHELSLVPPEDRARLHAALPGLAATLDASFPAHPAFPVAAHPERMPVGPAAHRRFLLDMLPIYHGHEMPGQFDHGAGYHGRGHICRAFIFASTMAGIMESMGHTVDRTALLCGIAGHDAGRTSNGADTPAQEAESARLALERMHASFGPDTLGADYEREFEAAIVGHASPTLESMLLNAADSLDIGRVKSFDFKYMPFLRGGPQEGPQAAVPDYQALREQLHEEADLLARLTDPMTQVRDLRMKLAEAGELETMVEVQRGASDAVRGQLALDSEEDFLAFVEGKIRTHPDMFPLLTRHYLAPLDA